ncbi:hypothetical protein [Oligella urethralis]|uniref:hypothetical protein n=1 Tax=Oligella urethralis TaxID=90245 RepID=UPI000E0FE5A2|nr:hypothetical protein [Oligella urethralis]
MKHKDSYLIDLLGGTTIVAEHFKLNKSTISGWRKNGIPRIHMMYLEIKFKNLIKKWKEELEELTKEVEND